MWDWLDFAAGVALGAVAGFLILSIMLAVYLGAGGKAGR